MRMEYKGFAPEYYMLAEELQCQTSHCIPRLFF